MEKEAHGIIKDLPNLRPYNLSIPINKTLITNLPREATPPLSQIGIDVTIISPTNPNQLSECWNGRHFVTSSSWNVRGSSWMNKIIHLGMMYNRP
jgi:hypothetical protein